MCMFDDSPVISIRDLKEKDAVYAYKIFRPNRKDDLLGVYFGGPYRLNKVYNAEVTSKLFLTDNSYNAGFHSFRDIDSTIEYQDRIHFHSEVYLIKVFGIVIAYKARYDSLLSPAGFRSEKMKIIEKIY